MRSIKIRDFILLVILLGGLRWNINQGMAQEIAPYAFGNIPSTNVLRLLHLQKSFLLKRLKKYSQSGMDQASLASTYVAIAGQTGELSFIDKAEVMAQKSLINLPFYNNNAKLILADVAEARHQFPKAIEIASDILKEGPRNIGALNTMVTASFGYGKLKEAEQFAARLVQTSAPDLSNLTLLALTKIAQGKNSEGLANFNKALSLEGPDQRFQSAWLRSLIARYYYRSKDFETARKYVDSALLVTPDYHVALALRAEIEAKRENKTEAILLFKKAYRSREEPLYLLSIANIKEQEGKLKEAEKLRREAEIKVRREIEQTLYGHYNELAQILIDRGNPSQRDEAIEAAKKNLEQRNNSEGHFILAKAYFNAGKINEARSSLYSGISTGETNFEYQSLAAELQ